MQRLGFTLIDTLALAALAATLGAVWTATAPQPAPQPEGMVERPLAVPQRQEGLMTAMLAARQSGRTLKDADQLRLLVQSADLFAIDNNDMFPMPSRLDRNNFTIDALPESKDTTGNIYSIFIQYGYVTAALIMSPLERNPAIKPYNDYELSEPTAATDPKRAMWDPGLSADFTDADGGHTSYAHHVPEPSSRWKVSFRSTDITFANRGP